MSSYGAARCLSLAYRRNQCCIKLKLAIQFQFRELLMSNLNCICYLGNIIMFSGTHRRIGQHSYLRLCANQHLEALCGQTSDLSQLVGIEVSVYCTVSEYEQTVLTELAIRNFHQEEARYRADTRFGLQKLQSRTNGVAGRMACTRYSAVSIAALAHQASIVHIVFLHLLFCNFRSNTFFAS